MTANANNPHRNPVLGKKFHIPLLLVILAIGFWLRTKEITWGLPEVHPYLNRTMDALHPDESVLVQEAADLREKGLFRIPTLRYPPLHAQLTAMVTEWFWGSAGQWQQFLVARGVSIAAGLGSLLLLYFIALRWRPSVAWMACALFSVTMVSVRESHWANPESLSSFWVLAAFLVLSRMDVSQTKLRYAAIGIALALGIASKYFAALFVHLPILACFLGSKICPAGPGIWNRFASFHVVRKNLLPAYGAFALALFLLLGIYVARSPQMFVEAFQTHSLWAGRNGLYGIFPKPVSVPAYLTSILPIALVPPLYLLGLAGMALSIFKRQRMELILIAAILPFGAFLELLRYHPLRFSLSLAPFVCLFAALFLDHLFRQNSRWRSGLAIVVLTAVLVYSGVYSYCFIDVLHPGKDARLLATDWLSFHVRQARRIALFSVSTQSNSLGLIHYEGMDRLSGSEYSLADGEPEYVVVPKHVAYIFDQHDRLTAEGYRYTSRDWAPMNPPNPDALEFYRAVKSGASYRPVAEFSSVPRFGPLIFHTEPLKFDLALTNLELRIYRKM